MHDTLSYGCAVRVSITGTDWASGAVRLTYARPPRGVRREWLLRARQTHSISKVENRQAAVAIHFAHNNFVRVHKTGRVTPAMAAGVSNTLWSLEELVEQMTKA
jgi:hypothetical protein